jgi:nucleotide-binding universal stress UspA family protein
MTPVSRLVVGVDGSPASWTALGWALEEAGRRGTALDVVHVWSGPVVPPVLGGGVRIDPADLRRWGQELLDEVVEEAHRCAGVVPVHPVLVEGDARERLLEAADGADLLVLGSRGLGRVMGVLLGSVSAWCASHAPCPVVVIDLCHAGPWSRALPPSAPAVPAPRGGSSKQ